MAKERPQPVPRPLGSIRSDELLPVREMCRRLGWERRTLAHAKREGLRVIAFGRFRYVRGGDLVEFFDRLAEQQAGGNGEANPQ